MLGKYKYAALLSPLLLAACTSVPTGPTVAVMPGNGKSIEQFNADNEVCKQFASNQISGAAQDANNRAVESGVVGTLIGAGVGAAFGGHQGAAVGAGAGLLVGSANGTNSSQYAGYTLQRRYDVSYEQCMYTKGNSVPITGQLHHQQQPAYAPQGYAPPPPNMPPPPPPPQ